MSTDPRRPAKRLLIAPALILVAVLASVILTRSGAEAPADDAFRIPGLGPTISAEHQDCRRDLPGTPPADAPLPTTRGRITSSQVVDCPEAFDGRRVSYTGEVIGDLLQREGGAWVLVNDDDYALAVGPLPGHQVHRGTNSGLTVWLPSELADRITGLGRPNQRGDIIHIQGHIRRTDPDDGGGLTLRADSLEVLEPAQRVNEPLHRPQAVLALTSLTAAIALATVRRRSRA